MCKSGAIKSGVEKGGKPIKHQYSYKIKGGKNNNRFFPPFYMEKLFEIFIIILQKPESYNIFNLFHIKYKYGFS